MQLITVDCVCGIVAGREQVVDVGTGQPSLGDVNDSDIRHGATSKHLWGDSPRAAKAEDAHSDDPIF